MPNKEISITAELSQQELSCNRIFTSYYIYQIFLQCYY